MAVSRLIESRSARLACVVIGASLLLWSCATSPEPPPAPSSQESAARSEPPKPEPKRRKTPAPVKRPVLTPELEEKLARVQLALLERDTQIQHLRKQLDEAIQETVRSKARLRSQENKADAASNLAEVEVALKTLQDALGGVEKRPEVAQANSLMAMWADELKKENYSGSLYRPTRSRPS